MSFFQLKGYPINPATSDFLEQTVDDSNDSSPVDFIISNLSKKIFEELNTERTPQIYYTNLSQSNFSSDSGGASFSVAAKAHRIRPNTP